MNPGSISRKQLSPASIYCVGKNYPEHAREMLVWEQGAGNRLDTGAQEEPVIFMKPGSALAEDGKISIPSFRGRPISDNLHYEVELVLLIGRDTDRIDIDQASGCIAAYGVGLDMTLRDVQLDAKKAGNPWLKSKGFRNSAVISDFVTPDRIGETRQLTISLLLNGSLVQHAPASDMTFPPAYLVHYLSHIYGLRKGDLIFTGTPSGVGRVETGDRLEASLETASNSQPESARLATLESIVI